jgi:RNA polymerase sigma factor (sigma-70 family)
MPPTALAANTQLEAIVHAARRGENLAWVQLVDRFGRMLHNVARSYRLSAQDVDDAVQATWIKLYEHIDRVRDTSAIAGWLATTVRRESLRLLQAHVRERLTDDPELAGEQRQAGPEALLLESEQSVVLTRALATLPDRQRELMTLIVAERAESYEQISATLDIPVGSIGPIRARSLERLQRHNELREFAAAC